MDTTTPPQPIQPDVRAHGRMSLADLCQRLPAPAPARPAVPAPPPAEVAPTPPATTSAATPLPLNYATYPHLVDLIAEHADLPTLLSFRRTSRALSVLVDRVLAQRVQLAADPGGAQAHVRPRGVEGHMRALLPPYTVVDRVLLVDDGVVAPPPPPSIRLPRRTYRHVLVLEFGLCPPPSARAVAACAAVQMCRSVPAESETHRAVYPHILDVVFAPRPGVADAGAAAGPDDPPEVVDVFRRTRPTTFFGGVLNSLLIVDRLPHASVRVCGVHRLPPRLVSSSLGASSTPDEVVVAVYTMVRDRLVQEEVRRRPDLAVRTSSVRACLERLSFLDD